MQYSTLQPVYDLSQIFYEYTWQWNVLAATLDIQNYELHQWQAQSWNEVQMLETIFHSNCYNLNVDHHIPMKTGNILV